MRSTAGAPGGYALRSVSRYPFFFVGVGDGSGFPSGDGEVFGSGSPEGDGAGRPSLRVGLLDGLGSAVGDGSRGG
jgi:hypothetical protein